MRITLINTSDRGGGAANIALTLHKKYLNLDHKSRLIVAKKATILPTVYQIPKTGWERFWDDIDRRLLKSHVKGAYRLHNLISVIKSPIEAVAHKTGRESYHHPEAENLVKEFTSKSDVFHLHNLHYDYFDLRLLPNLSKQKPVLITMHDEYLYTGLCASTLGCERWRTGCGNCPQLENYPSYKRDNTHNNWRRKKNVFSESNVTLVTPSNWLAKRTQESFLSHLPLKVIPNGIDLSVFNPGSKVSARNKLSLSQETFVLLSTIKSGRPGKYKDREMLDRVINQLRSMKLSKRITFVILGCRATRDESNGCFRLVEKPYLESQKKMAEYFRASDLYVHTADAETFGLTVCEAMACGAPVISTNAGGIPELVNDGETGYTVPIGNHQKMVAHIIDLMDDDERLEKMGQRASEITRTYYGIERMVDDYVQLYKELICKHEI